MWNMIQTIQEIPAAALAAVMRQELATVQAFGRRAKDPDFRLAAAARERDLSKQLTELTDGQEINQEEGLQS